MTVRGPHHGDVDADVVEPDDTVHPASLDWRLALQLHAKFDKERSSSLKVVDNDADVIHPLNRHIPSIGWMLGYAGEGWHRLLADLGVGGAPGADPQRDGIAPEPREQRDRRVVRLVKLANPPGLSRLVGRAVHTASEWNALW